MPRRPVGEKHPALMRVDEEVQKHVESIEGWRTFSTRQKEFLLLLPWFGTFTATCKQMGLTIGAFEQWGRHNVGFKVAAHAERAQRTLIAREATNDLLGMSVQWLRFWLDPSNEVSDNQRTQAIKIIHSITKFTDDEKTPAQYITATNVMFEGARSG
jgi:hypothetical protein